MADASATFYHRYVGLASTITSQFWKYPPRSSDILQISIPGWHVASGHMVYSA